MWFRSLLKLLAAATASLVVVLSFIGIFGIFFLKGEAEQFDNPQGVTVTHSLARSNSQGAVSLFWNLAVTGRSAVQRHLVIHRLDARPGEMTSLCPHLNPLALAPGPDADHVLVGDCDGSIFLLDLRHPTAEPIHIGRQPDGSVIDLACSPDGRLVVAQGPFRLCAWDLATRSPRWCLEDFYNCVFSLRPESSLAILSTRRNELIEIDLADGCTLRTLAHYRAAPSAVALCPDGNHLAILLANGHLQLLDSHTAAVRWEKESPGKLAWATGRFVAFSPTGKLLVTAAPDRASDLTVWDVTTGQPIKELRGHTNFVNGAAFAPDGSLRSWGLDRTIRVWNLDAGIAKRVISLMPPPKRT